MTDHSVVSYPGYATPTFTFNASGRWIVTAAPWDKIVGLVEDHTPGGWTAQMAGRHVGLFPDKQAAGEALVRHAGYEVLR